MKKNKYIFFFMIFFLVLFINIKSVRAVSCNDFVSSPSQPEYDKNKINCEDCLLLCGYSDSDNRYGVYIAYHYSSDEFIIGYSQKNINTVGGIATEFTTFSCSTSTNPPYKLGLGNKIYYQDNAKDNSTTGAVYMNLATKGICPYYSYVYSFWSQYLSDTLCFDKNDKYCKSIEDFDTHKTLKNNYVEMIEAKFRELIRLNCDTIIDDKDAKGLKRIYFTDINNIDDKNIPTIFLDNYKGKRKEYIERIKTCEKELIEINPSNTSEIKDKAKAIIEAANKINLGIDSNIIDEEVTDCSDMLGGNLVKFINLVYLIFKIAAVALLILFLFLDFAGATASSDKDALKNASQKAIKRVIIMVAIFLLPLVIRVIGKIAGLDFSCILNL